MRALTDRSRDLCVCVCVFPVFCPLTTAVLTCAVTELLSSTSCTQHDAPRGDAADSSPLFWPTRIKINICIKAVYGKIIYIFIYLYPLHSQSEGSSPNTPVPRPRWMSPSSPRTAEHMNTWTPPLLQRHSPSSAAALWSAAVGQTCSSRSLLLRAKPRTQLRRPRLPCLSRFSGSSSGAHGVLWPGLTARHDTARHGCWTETKVSWGRVAAVATSCGRGRVEPGGQELRASGCAAEGRTSAARGHGPVRFHSIQFYLTKSQHSLSLRTLFRIWLQFLQQPLKSQCVEFSDIWWWSWMFQLNTPHLTLPSKHEREREPVVAFSGDENSKGCLVCLVWKTVKNMVTSIERTRSRCKCKVFKYKGYSRVKETTICTV